MTEYAICFDFPEGSTWFAHQTPGEAFGFTSSVDVMARFESEEIAARVLANAYGPETRKFASVVEVGS